MRIPARWCTYAIARFLFSMKLNFQYAQPTDAPALAVLNRQLIEDEGSRTRLTELQLADRMRGWLSNNYRAAIFESNGDTVAYALWRADGEDVYLRQFFVQRPLRRHGLGRECIDLLFTKVLAGKRIVLEVLTTNPGGLGFWKSVGFSEYAVTLEKTIAG